MRCRKKASVLNTLPTGGAALAAIFVSVFALTACGGGGSSGGSAPAPAPVPGPPPPAGPSLAECLTLPAGVTNTFLNTARPRHEWKAATFQGQAVVGRYEFAAGASAPSMAWYYVADTAARTLATVGTDIFDALGNVVRTVTFTGRVHSTALTAGQGDSAHFTVHVVTPPGTPDESQLELLNYIGSEEITLPGGRLQTCKVSTNVSTVAGAINELWQEQINFAKDIGPVKNYYTPTGSVFLLDRGQTYLFELSASSASVPYASAAAATTPSLASCGAMAASQNLVVTASNLGEATSVRRSTQSGTFNGVATLQVNRRSLVPDQLQAVYHFDPTVGALQLWGVQTYNVNGTISSTDTYGGHPNLSGVGLGQTLSYSETITSQPGAMLTTNDSFSFAGYEKVTTPAGTFDTCKVRFDYGDNNGGGSETYYLVPNVHWARLDRVTKAGVRTTRELISR